MSLAVIRFARRFIVRRGYHAWPFDRTRLGNVGFSGLGDAIFFPNVHHGNYVIFHLRIKQHLEHRSIAFSDFSIYSRFFFSILLAHVIFSPISEISFTLLWNKKEKNRRRWGQHSSTIITYTLKLITRMSYSVFMPCNFPAISGKIVSKSRSRAQASWLVKGKKT